MTSKNLSPRGLLLGAILLSIILPTGLLHAQLRPSPDRDAGLVFQRWHERSLRDLNSGSPERMIRAADFFASARKPFYVRPVGFELLRNLQKGSPFLRMPGNDPFVKTSLAVTLGRIGHFEALPFLLDALERTGEIIDAEKERLDKLRARERAFAKSFDKPAAAGAGDKKQPSTINEKAIPRLILEQERPGPAAMRKGGHAIPYSPDVHYSVSDEFKHVMAPVLTDPNHRMRLKGYNYVNLAMGCLHAVGLVYEKQDIVRRKLLDTKFIERVDKFLNHRLPAIRASAASAMADMDLPLSKNKLETRFKAEKDPVVKIRIGWAIMTNDRRIAAEYLFIIDQLRHRDYRVRYEAAVALRKLRIAEAFDALNLALKLETEPQVRVVLTEARRQSQIDNLTPVSEYHEKGPSR